MSERRSAVRRALVLLVVIGGWLAIAAVGGPALGSLSEVTSNDKATYLPKSAESVLAQQKLAELNDSQALPAFAVLEGDEPVAALQAADGGAGTGGPPGAAYAQQVTDQITVNGEPLSEYLVEPPIAIAADDQSGVLLIYSLDSAKVAANDADGESVLTDVITSMRDGIAQASGADTAYVGGPAGLGVDTGEAFAGIDGLLLVVTLSIVLVILLVVYRSVLLPLFVLFSSVCGLALSGYIVYLLADAEVITLNGQSQGILSILVIGAATDYSLLVVARYREELLRSSSISEAMRIAWRRSIEPITASAGTVILGLLCLLLSDLNSNRGLGPVGALGIVAAYLVSLTLLPALLLLGRWVFWPRVPRPRAESTAQPLAAEKTGLRRGLWARVADLVVRQPRRVWVGVGVALLALCAAVPSFRASGTDAFDVFLTDVESVQAQQVIDEYYDLAPTDPLQIAVESADAEEVLEQVGGIDGVQDAAITAGDSGTPISQIDVYPSDGTTAESLVDQVRSVAHQASPSSLVGGDAAVRLDTAATAQSDLQVIIPIILLVVLLVLIALLRSVVAPLILVAATVVSFGAAIGVAALVFNHVLGFPGADPVVPLLGFVFLVALGVDYSIFLMTRAREEVAEHGPVEGVTRSLRVTGGVITSAGIVLAATFAALAVIPLLFMAQIAFIVAFGVLLDTFVVRSFLVPALAIDLGRRTWWPSRLSRTTSTEAPSTTDAPSGGGVSHGA